MKYSYTMGCQEENVKNTMFYKKENGINAHELVEVSIKATGDERQEIMKMAKKAMEELFENIKKLLENGDSEKSPQ